MPPLRKAALFGVFEDSLRRSGLSFLRLAAEGDHPAAYQVIRDQGSFRVRVYIWNLTPGAIIAHETNGAFSQPGSMKSEE